MQKFCQCVRTPDRKFYSNLAHKGQCTCCKRITQVITLPVLKGYEEFCVICLHPDTNVKACARIIKPHLKKYNLTSGMVERKVPPTLLAFVRSFSCGTGPNQHPSEQIQRKLWKYSYKEGK